MSSNRVIYQGEQPATPPTQRKTNVIPHFGGRRTIEAAQVADPVPLINTFPYRKVDRTR